MKLQVIACDKCGSREDKKDISEWTARRGSTRYTGDLCDKCFQQLLKDYGPQPMSRSRHTIEATDINKIPKVDQ